jgi:hypothetical protein
MGDIDAELDEAYRATIYRVFVPGEAPIDVRVDGASSTHAARLGALLARNGVEVWAFITAWNPGSRQLSAEENAARHAELLQAIEAGGWPHFDGAGIPARADWSPEASLLVLGISRDDAVALGRRFSQNAIVAGRRGGAAELIYCG